MTVREAQEEEEDDTKNDVQWVYQVGSPFPSVWFGGCPWHSDVPTLRSHNIINYSSAYFGWQLMNAVPAPVGGCHHEETLLREQTTAVKAMAPEVKTLAYIGNGASALCFYDAQNELCQNPTKFSGFFLPEQAAAAAGAKQDSGKVDSGRVKGGVNQRSAIGGAAANCPTSKLTFDFRNISMVDFFVNSIVGPWAADNVTDSVFIDEGDSIAMFGHPGLPTLEDRYKWSNGSVDAYRRSAALLAKNGKRLVVSLKNGFRGAAPIASKFPPCIVPLDDFVAGMQGVPFIRFHEYWGALSTLDNTGGESKINGSTMCHNLIRTAQREAATPGMAFSGHAGDYWNHYPSVQKASLDFGFALFMLARNATAGGEIDFFGWSTGAPPGNYWNSAAWHWNDTAALYTKRYGEPKGLATVRGDVWTRVYDETTFTVDCANLTATAGK